MSKNANDGARRLDLIEVLSAHFNSLVAARCDEAILDQYAALLRQLKSTGVRFSASPASPKASPVSHPLSPENSLKGIQSASLNELERIVKDSDSPRRTLEQIAIFRFDVPRGSMRSFTNKQILAEKILSLIENERTHRTIGKVARLSGR